MSSQFGTGGFEKRLLVFFLLLSLTPTLLIAILGGRYFMESFERVGSPALKESARNSMEIARKLQAKLEEDADAIARCLADEYHEMRRAPGSARMTGLLRAVSEKHLTDFVALYTLEETSWKLASCWPTTIARADSTMGLDLVPPPGEPRKIIFSDQDVIVSGVRCGPDSVFVAGFLLDTGTMEMMRMTGEDLSRYSAMPLYARSQGIFLIFVISATVVVMVVASIIASRLIARRISHPIKELALATERIARGDLDHRVTVAARDEIQSLVTAFNHMTEDLQEYKENLIRAERIAAWRDVARRIAHEIRNPLTPIEIAIYRMKKRLEADQEDSRIIEESLDSILKQVASLKTMAEEFSSFAKLPEPEFESLDVNDLVKSVLDLYTSSLEKIDVKADYGPDLPRVMADANQVTGVVSNLVKNAIEAMADGGNLTLKTSFIEPTETGDSGVVRIEITDTGHGIPDEIREKVFDPYFTTKAKGTGLGLAIAYRIVEDHGGRIDFETGERGTTFILDLRIARDAHDEQDAASEEAWGKEAAGGEAPGDDIETRERADGKSPEATP